MSIIQRGFASFSTIGFILGSAFFSASLTPSLLPREFVVQGALSGVAFAVGYGIGVAGQKLWKFMELRDLEGRFARILGWLSAVLLALIAIYTLNRTTIWQNSIRLRMEMEPVDSTYPLTEILVTIVTALVVILLARLISFVATKIVGALDRYLPRRIAIVLGGAVVAMVLMSFIDGFILKIALQAMDETFAAKNRLLDDTYELPKDDRASGSERSLIAWNDIGRNGKRFVADGPTKGEIESILGRRAMQPIRVYAGYDTGDDLEKRAEIALAELIRVGGFDRSILIIATTTGTGWLDPSAVNTVEFLHAGDIATVTLQYSYLPSWLTLLVDPESAELAAKSLFSVVYKYWASLPIGERPKLFLHGLSLGALGSQSSFDLISVIADPINGALWSGSPFQSEYWKTVTRGRNPGSPQWRPIYRDSAAIRFMTQEGFPDLAGAKWGPLRIVYLQHASDPMSFFSLDLVYARPSWLGPDRARDVSPYLKWFPIVTFFQVGFDLSMATNVSLGYGHNFAPVNYIDGWIEVTQPTNWSAADTKKLKIHFADFNPTLL